MPMPLGHTAIGLAAFATAQRAPQKVNRLALLASITILANLPDLDMLAGLLLNGNGAFFHRGPTHSLLFALAMGWVASRLMRRWPNGPQLSFAMCALLIFSHVAADMFLTRTPISLLWPLELNWARGYHSWGNVFHLAIFQSMRDFIIAAWVMVYLFILRLLRRAQTPTTRYTGFEKEFAMKKHILLTTAALALIAVAAFADLHTVQTATKEGVGTYLTDAKGMTLYWFAKDAAGTSHCDAGCLEKWPVYYREKVAPPAGVDAADFGVITRGDGQKQTTFRGWPLYYFVMDKAAGDTKGQGLKEVWFVIDPAHFPTK